MSDEEIEFSGDEEETKNEKIPNGVIEDSASDTENEKDAEFINDEKEDTKEKRKRRKVDKSELDELLEEAQAFTSLKKREPDKKQILRRAALFLWASIGEREKTGTELPSDKTDKATIKKYLMNQLDEFELTAESLGEKKSKKKRSHEEMMRHYDAVGTLKAALADNPFVAYTDWETFTLAQLNEFCGSNLGGPSNRFVTVIMMALKKFMSEEEVQKMNFTEDVIIKYLSFSNEITAKISEVVFDTEESYADTFNALMHGSNTIIEKPYMDGNSKYIQMKNAEIMLKFSLQNTEVVSVLRKLRFLANFEEVISDFYMKFQAEKQMGVLEFLEHKEMLSSQTQRDVLLKFFESALKLIHDKGSRKNTTRVLKEGLKIVD